MTRLSRRAVVLLAALVVVLAGLATTGTWLVSRSSSAWGGRGSGGYGPGMMGGYGGHGPGMMGGYGYGDGYGYGAGAVGWQPVDRQAALGNQVPAGAVIDTSARRIRLTGSTVDLTMLADSSLGPDLTFRAAGLSNPTVVVPVGATVRLTMVNAADDDRHDWLLVAAAPPYPVMGAMMAGVAFPGAATGMLPPATSSNMPTQTISFTADQAGTYHYLCAYPGHAAKGMYGTLVVASP